MYSGKPLNIFYSEPDPDRWLPYDRYPRRAIRRIVRGEPKIGGVQQVAINLLKGLDRLGVAYRFNEYRYAKQHPEEIVCIVGKPHVLFGRQWKNPVILGSGVYSHPLWCPDLLEKYSNVHRFLVPGEWMRQMFEPYYHDKVTAWPTGIDTYQWTPFIEGSKQFDFLIYDKVRWEHERYEKELIQPLRNILDKHKLSYQFITYGNYDHNELTEKLKNSKAVIFLCEHETQGFAYQQILATNTPILAWDRGGYWQDPEYYPARVKFEPVSSVPYWDERCGTKFRGAGDFEQNLEVFLNAMDKFKPRDYIMENLTLEKCAQKYLDIYSEIERELV